MSDNLKTWNALARPPATALKQIKGGRLQGMTDVNPQWRYQAMTEQYGPCGIGWKWTLVRTWSEVAPNDQVMAFAEVAVCIREGREWSDPIPGIGGSMLVAQESKGLHANDEAYKMATTDALSVALKMLGVAADIYAGRWDGAKYTDAATTEPFDERGYQAWFATLHLTAQMATYGELVDTIKQGPEAFQDALRNDKKAWNELKALAVQS